MPVPAAACSRSRGAGARRISTRPRRSAHSSKSHPRVILRADHACCSPWRVEPLTVGAGAHRVARCPSRPARARSRSPRKRGPPQTPAWNKGIKPVDAESYYNAIECGKQGGNSPACVFWDTGTLRQQRLHADVVHRLQTSGLRSVDGCQPQTAAAAAQFPGGAAAARHDCRDAGQGRRQRVEGSRRHSRWPACDRRSSARSAPAGAASPSTIQRSHRPLT